jgi:hypothetical protein
MDFELIENTLGIKIETPEGFQSFTHIAKSKHFETIELLFNDNSSIKGSLNHKIKTEEDKFISLADITIGTKLKGEIVVNDKFFRREEIFLYDLIDVERGNQYITGSIISHNCEFLSSDSLLIKSLKLNELRSETPALIDQGFKFWAEDIRSQLYIVGCDIATGSGSDFSVIEVFAFPSLVQVGEYRSNELNIPQLYEKIKMILNRLTRSINGKRADCLWTFERNGVGEAIAALYNTDEHPPEYAELVNDVPGKFGMVTSSKNKVLSCLQLKSLIEKVRNGLHIKSEINIFELKNFIATGGSYAGKQGATDDSVMALVLIVRLLKYIAEFDNIGHDIMYKFEQSEHDIDNIEFTDEPIPMVM